MILVCCTACISINSSSTFLQSVQYDHIVVSLSVELSLSDRDEMKFDMLLCISSSNLLMVTDDK